jgi:hypothetical protein
MATEQRYQVEDIAAELTEVAFPVALARGIGTDWLDKKLELWKSLTQTVCAWQQRIRGPVSA